MFWEHIVARENEKDFISEQDGNVMPSIAHLQ